MRQKVNAKTELEFITEVADDCIAHLNTKNREHLINNPCVTDCHFSFGLYIRNHYIHNKDFSDASFIVEPDSLSSAIIRMIFSKLLPEYEYGNMFVELLYDDDRFIKIRQEYKNIYGEYPVYLIEKYKKIIPLEHEFEINKRNYEKYSRIAEQLIKELAEQVWRIDELKKMAEDCGICFQDLVAKIEVIKKIFFEEEKYIPMEVCLLPYKQDIGHERYIQLRRTLSKQLKLNPDLVEKLDPSYFRDRVLARTVLKYGWTLKYLTEYQDDEVMVKYCLIHDGEAIQYASKRFQTDRDWVKLAIEHSKNGTIMYLDCLKPYRKDKELVYLACKVARWNFVYVDKTFRDDYELAKICMEQIGDFNSIYMYMSARLRGNKELAMLDIQEDYPNIEYYSPKLRNDDQIAAELYRLHGASAQGWHYMSKRLRKKYHIEE